MTVPGLADQVRAALGKLEELEALVDGFPGEHDHLWSHLADIRVMLQRRLGRIEQDLLTEQSRVREFPAVREAVTP